MGVYRGIYWDNGKETGIYYSILGIYKYWHNGKGNGNYYSIQEYTGVYTGIMEKEMETTIVYRSIYCGYIGRMGKEMETAIVYS